MSPVDPQQTFGTHVSHLFVRPVQGAEDDTHLGNIVGTERLYSDPDRLLPAILLQPGLEHVCHISCEFPVTDLEADGRELLGVVSAFDAAGD
jgi:hypothetical protein